MTQPPAPKTPPRMRLGPVIGQPQKIFSDPTRIVEMGRDMHTIAGLETSAFLRKDPLGCLQRPERSSWLLAGLVMGH